MKPKLFPEDNQCTSLETSVAHWQEVLAVFKSELEIPTDFTLPPDAACKLKHHLFSISCSKPVEGLSRLLGTDLSTTLIAAYAALLYRYTHHSPIVIGLPTIEH